MSADLFAEFNNLSSSASQPSQPKPSASTGTPQNQPSQDPFAFLQSTSSNAAPSPATQPWPAFQPQPWSVSQPHPSSQSLWDQPSKQSPPQFQPQTQTQPSWSSWSSPTKPQGPAEDDDWGDFEVAESSTQHVAPSQGSQSISWQTASPIQYTDPAPAAAAASVQVSEPRSNLSSQDQMRSTRIVRASTMDLISNNLVNIESSTSAASQSPVRTIQEMPQKATRTKVVPKSAASDPSILFDANDFELQEAEGEDSENDDEFGDFETVPQPEATPKAQPKSGQVSSQTTSVAETKPKPPPEMDLLSLDDPPYSKPTAQSPPLSSPSKLLSFGATATGSASHDRQSSHSSSAKAKPHPTRPSKPVQSVMEKNAASNDDWGAWDDFVAADATEKDRARNRASKEIMSSTDVAAPSIEAPDGWQWDSVETIKATVPTVLDNNAAPPVNVPPPSVLLSAFTGLLGSGNSLFKPMGGQSTSIKQKIMTDPKAVDFIRGYILLASTAAHVIAGRKQRWHRDKILAKSMTISAAGSKGMKLAGVDKAQSAREDRDAADVVAVWRDNVGRLRSAVAAANASSNESLKVPEISETMPVHADKFALTAPKPCVICGLKREERVAKVDQDVEDSFGEWWIDHWGHRACKNFWVEHEQTLRQR